MNSLIFNAGEYINSNNNYWEIWDPMTYEDLKPYLKQFDPETPIYTTFDNGKTLKGFRYFKEVRKPIECLEYVADEEEHRVDNYDTMLVGELLADLEEISGTCSDCNFNPPLFFSYNHRTVLKSFDDRYFEEVEK